MATLRNLMAAVVLGGIAAGASAQTTSSPLTQLWKVQADDPNSTYILSTSNNVRGMFLDPSTTSGGSLLVVSRDGGANAVYRLDTETGALKSPPNIPNSVYITSGDTFHVNKAVVSSDGIIYVMNLGVVSTAAEQHFRIYRHADELSEATIAADVRTDNFSGNGGPGVAMRLGDDADIIGTGNNTRILVAGSGAGMMLFTTTDNGMTFTGTKIVGTPAFTGSSPNVAFDPDDPTRFYYRDAAPGVNEAYVITGGTATGVTGAGNSLPGVEAGGYGPFDIGAFNNVKSIVLGIGNSAATQTNKAILVDRLSDLATTYYALGSEFTGGAKSNLNASGDVYLDSANNAIYVLYTNNSVTKYGFPASVGNWSMY